MSHGTAFDASVLYVTSMMHGERYMHDDAVCVCNAGDASIESDQSVKAGTAAYSVAAASLCVCCVLSSSCHAYVCVGEFVSRD